MIDFPASPTVGQIFTSGGQQWLFDGTKWLPNGQINTAVVPMNDNRLINGDMRIDQRNDGASGTAITYTVDRWAYTATQASKGTWGRNVGGIGVFPLGFPYCLGFQASSAYPLVASDYFMLVQPIEADMISDFQWGTANAQSVILQFWALSSLTGTFSGSIRNYAGTRSYPFTYSISTAGAWIKVAVTIPGDTAGTWVMSGSGGAASVAFSLGAGATFSAPGGVWAGGNFIGANGAISVVSTNSATFFVTGVKLEIGSVATPFGRQSLAKSMADCQRYYEMISLVMFSGNVTSGSVYYSSARYKVDKRITPTVVLIDNGNNGFPAGLATAFSNNYDILIVSKTANATLNGGSYSWGATASAEL